ncbi:hypothetical protein ASE74_21385 [Pedobacter sp. Leaf216]|nr:hypothetical protein ASE74_21385 [Pedobacter sp. Leaf216]
MKFELFPRKKLKFKAFSFYDGFPRKAKKKRINALLPENEVITSSILLGLTQQPKVILSPGLQIFMVRTNKSLCG